MTENEIKVRIRHMVGSADGSVPPDLSAAPYRDMVPKPGEVVYYADLRKLKVGDGTRTLALLPFADAPGSHSHGFGALTGGPTREQMIAGINSLEVGTSTPADADYYVAQHASGLSNNYYRKPVSALYNYIKGRLPAWATAATKPSYGFNEIGQRGEALLGWGGANKYNDFSPVDAGIAGRLGANRTAFVNPDAVTVEHSRDAGATWSDYGATDSQKTGFFTDFMSGFRIGKSSSANIATADCRLRVTLRTGGHDVYTVLEKFLIYVGTEGSQGCWCTIDARLQKNVTDNTDAWDVYAGRVPISGWTGYNVINTHRLTTFGNVPDTQYGEIRLTFGCTSHRGPYAGLRVHGVNCYGGVGWSTPSTYARTGRLYGIDAGQNALFPKRIVSDGFVVNNGDSSMFLKGDGSLDNNTYLTSHQDIGGKEDKSNKVTAWSATTTDAHYPSERLVKAALDGKAAATHGTHLPALQTADDAVYLRNDNSWQTITPAKIGAAAAGHSHSGYKTVQPAVADPAPAGESTSFIKTLSQDANGAVTATKACLPYATRDEAGIVKLDEGGAAPYEHAHDDYVTLGTTQTITAKKTMAGGMAFTSAALPVDNGMRYFLGIDGFAAGGTVKYADATRMCGMIGAVPVATLAAGFSTPDSSTTNINMNTPGNFYYEVDAGSVTVYRIVIDARGAVPGCSLRLFLKSNAVTDFMFTRPDNNGGNKVYVPRNGVGASPSTCVVVDLFSYKTGGSGGVVKIVASVHQQVTSI